MLRLAQDLPLAALEIDRNDLISLREDIFNDFGRMVFGKKDPVMLANDWQKHDLKLLLNWLTIW